MQLSDVRREFWEFYLSRHPMAAQAGIKVQRGWNGYTALQGGDIQVSIWIGERVAGVYVRGGWGERKHEAARLLGPDLPGLTRSLGCETYQPENAQGHVFGQRLGKSYREPADWPAITDWMEERRTAYVCAIRAVLGA